MATAASWRSWGTCRECRVGGRDVRKYNPEERREVGGGRSRMTGDRAILCRRNVRDRFALGTLARVATVMAGPTGAWIGGYGRCRPYGALVEERAQERPVTSRISRRVAGVTRIALVLGDVDGWIDRDRTPRLSLVTGAASSGGNARVVECCAQECDEVVMTCIAVRCRRSDYVGGRIADYTRIDARTRLRAAMAHVAAARDAGVIHPPAQERGGVGMALFARQQCREVGHGLAYHAQGLVVMAVHAIASYADMLVASYKEIGRAGMAGVTFCDCRDVVYGFRFRAYPCAGGVAAGTIPRGVLENALDVALFAF